MTFGAQIARKAKKAQPPEKKKKTGWKAGELNSHKHVFFHKQSRRWRAVVKIKDGTRRTKNFQKLKDALAAASEGLGEPVTALKKPLPDTGMNLMQRAASLYEGVFVVSFWAPTGRLKPIGP